MKSHYIISIVIVCFPLVAQSRAADGDAQIAFDAYANRMKKADTIVFAGSCRMANGNLGVLTFAQSDNGGRYFELHGAITVRSERVIAPNGGYLLRQGLGTRYLGKGDGAIKTLLTVPYWAVYSGDLDVIVRVPARRKCFESDE